MRQREEFIQVEKEDAEESEYTRRLERIMIFPPKPADVGVTVSERGMMSLKRYLSSGIYPRQNRQDKFKPGNMPHRSKRLN